MAFKFEARFSPAPRLHPYRHSLILKFRSFHFQHRDLVGPSSNRNDVINIKFLDSLSSHHIARANFSPFTKIRVVAL
ncbi:hypothetical protein K1719_028625 [Acacia pycnantha]|nr:hypothetical protein K1719_028625 [Acacia pycnantha]